MEEVLHLVCCASNSHLFSRLHPRQCSSSSSSSSSYPSSSSSSPSSSSSFSAYGGHDRRTSPARALRCSSVFQENRTLPLPKKPPKPAGSGDDLDGGGGGNDDGGGLSCLRSEMPRPKDSTFQEKVLFLDSVGVDLLAASAAHPLLLSTPLSDLRATADFLLSAGGFSSAELHRICGMCPEVLTAGGPRALAPVFTFLIREAAVDGLSGLRRAVRRRPRLLISDVATRLRPTLYFLQMLGVVEIGRRHAPLLSCSVEEKLLPRIDFLQGVGFCPREARAMVRRFPQLFCYSIAGNLEPKFDFFAVEMKRSLRELRDFPQFFSFSLRRRIIPRHRRCSDAGVALPLPALLKPGDDRFDAHLRACLSSSPPLRKSPLWCERRRPSAAGGDPLGSRSSQS